MLGRGTAWLASKGGSRWQRKRCLQGCQPARLPSGPGAQRRQGASLLQHPSGSALKHRPGCTGALASWELEQRASPRWSTGRLRGWRPS